MAATASTRTNATRIGLVAATAAAVVFAVLGTGSVAGGQVAPPVVTASATDGLLTLSGNCSGSSTFSLDPATVSVTRTGDTSTELHVALAWSGTIPAAAYGAPEALVVPAGETTATFEVPSGDQSGTITVEIGASPDYDIGDPSTATARILQVIADPVCATVPASSSTTTALPSNQPPAAKPVASTPAYTG